MYFPQNTSRSIRITQSQLVVNEALSSVAVFFTTFQISPTKQLYSFYTTCCIGEMPMWVCVAFSGSPTLRISNNPPLSIMQDQYSTALTSKPRRTILLSLLTKRSVATRKHRSRAMKIQLHHVDLPLLEELDLIQWNRDTHSVTHGRNYETLRPQLRDLLRHQSLRN